MAAQKCIGSLHRTSGPVWRTITVFALFIGSSYGAERIPGHITDPQGVAMSGAAVRLVESQAARQRDTTTHEQGYFEFSSVAAGEYNLVVKAAGFAPVQRKFTVKGGNPLIVDLKISQLAPRNENIVITARVLEPSVELRNAELFNRTLFTRDDQVLQQLDAGINAGQHEGGGKSLEIRRFGFNLDHGGVNGGLKVLVDDIQQNQGSQGHGQGYLGSLKALSPELIQDLMIINGPFSAEYGDFSGLGVVHIRQRESLPEQFTARLQGGNFHNGRGFFAYSPDAHRTDAYIAYEGSYIDGPFTNPGRYRRDNVNGNYTKTVSAGQKLGFRILFGRNDFYSSGQIPLDLVNAGTLDRFGYLDPTDGREGETRDGSQLLQQKHRQRRYVQS